ncbi:hypothetical protein [Capillimicrobium parvum]|uniref:Uncharacterized protein n=1 Tax=Capillimicrobium parvum TaxID=2884022 RepID=A0A9E6XWM0_9ACTN|nr:hypothetical protein [Capillimicrobium parvum]UGS35500.1 hypothetical protein DSM104329_01893 [Capillimicrobium parvum]
MRRALRLLSQGWMEDAGKERDEGPFAFVQALPSGDLLVRVAGGWERHDTVRRAAEHAQPASDDDDAEPPRGGAEEEEEGACEAAQATSCPVQEARAA